MGNRPASITVFGVLNLVFGGLGVCGILGSFVVMLMPVNARGGNPVMEMMAENKLYGAMQMVMMVFGFLATVVLIASGVGLLQSKMYGRTLAIGYSLYSFVSVILGTLVNTIFVFLPLLNKLDAMPDGPNKMASIITVVSGIAGGVIGLIYPSLLLYFMTRKYVTEYLRA
jgi:magnesium-transporting ATPase (P-type)